MAVKTITIDMEAYGILSASKNTGDSFSKVIKRRLRPANTADNLLKHLEKFAISENTADALESVISSRKDSLTE
jgi:predicted CopG family antitoxin